MLLKCGNIHEVLFFMYLHFDFMLLKVLHVMLRTHACLFISIAQRCCVFVHLHFATYSIMACPSSVPAVSQEVHLGTAKQTKKVQGEKKPRVRSRVGACKNLGKQVSGQPWRLKWAKKDGLVPVEGGHFRVIQTGKEMTVVSRLE